MRRTFTGALAAVLLSAVPAATEPASWKREGWERTDFTRSAVKWDEIISGGPPRDGIPPIDNPVFEPVTVNTVLTAKDPVIGLEIAGDARAYPLRILIWHEIVNDAVGGKPVAVTYCPLCNSSVVLERHVAGRLLDFGTTGKLRSSDLVMYDRQTESWWQQFTGEGIVGEMTGVSLKLVPARLESFAEFKSRHPEGRVLLPPADSRRPYGRNPYLEYDSAAGPFLYRGELPKGIEAMARVVVVRHAAQPLIVAMDLVRSRGTVVMSGVHLSWRAGQVSAVDAAEIAESRDVGTIVAHALVDGQPGPLLPYDVTFAFVAHAFHPDVAIVRD
jgi:hypothetical protein